MSIIVTKEQVKNEMVGSKLVETYWDLKEQRDGFEVRGHSEECLATQLMINFVVDELHERGIWRIS